MSDFDVLESDVRLYRAMEHSNEIFLRALRGLPVVGARPRVIYETGGNFPRSPTAKRRIDEELAYEAAERRNVRVASLRVADRDPCTRCGVKGADHAKLGCKSFARAA